MNGNTAFPEQRGRQILDAFAVPSGARAIGPVDAIGAGAFPAGRRRVSWWLLPHVLSLDAPCVAVVWQHWWAHAAGVKLHGFQDTVLAMGVWMIYLADRLADTRHAGAEPPGTARHAFSARHRRVLRSLLASVVFGLAILTPAVLPGREFAAGLGLLLVAGGYFWLIHRHGASRWAGVIPKEAFVGIIFASGTTFFVACQGRLPAWPFWAGATLFAVLCFLNCALITQWETSVEDRVEPTSLLNAFPGLSGRLGRGCLLLAGLAGAASGVSGSLAFLPIALGALGLAWLDYQRAAVSPDALRVLADLALLAPVFCGAWRF